MSISTKVKKEGQRFNGRDAQSPHYYGSHWDDNVEEEENQLRNHHQQQQQQQQQVGRSGGGGGGGIPRQKFNVEFDYEDTIGTSSSGSFSSSAGYHQHNNQVPGPPLSTITHKNRYQQQQPHYQKHGNMMKAPSPHHHGGGGGGRMPEIPEKFRDEKDGSEIYVMDSAYMAKPPGSIYSHYSGKSRAPSEMSSVKTKTSRNGGVVVETMSAPNPCCPNTKGVCCLLVLVNLGLILITLGFSIVLQLFEPEFVWFFGVAFLIVGFIALIASLIFCLHLCRESRTRDGHLRSPGEMYWTHHWQKRIALPGMSREVEKDDVSTVYSARNEEDKYDQRNMTPIHTYKHHQ